MTTTCKFIDIHDVRCIVPADPDSIEKFQKAKLDRIYSVKFTYMRNPKFHRKTFALIKACFDNQDQFDSFDVFREHMKLAIGWVDYTVTTVRNSELARYAGHYAGCEKFDPYNSPWECSCGLEKALEADRVQTNVKTKSQAFGSCTESEAAELWPKLCDWAVEIIGADAVASFEGGW
jgi:hypothetical protein